ncbi:MAG: MBOAT family protein, partial [Acutalibacteraceae bacterium]
AALLLIEKNIPQRIRDKIPAFISHAYLIFAVIIGFVIFNGNGISGAIADLHGMFLPVGSFSSLQTVYYLRSYSVLFAVGIFGSTPALKIAAERLSRSKKSAVIADIAKPILILLLLTVCAAYLVDSSYNPFLYFRF